jgi:hypothetical protein
MILGGRNQIRSVNDPGQWQLHHVISGPWCATGRESFVAHRISNLGFDSSEISIMYLGNIGIVPNTGGDEFCCTSRFVMILANKVLR